MKRKIVVITIDGGDPDYFRYSDIPNINQMMANGFQVTANSVIPSVTNVNNISIVTGAPPAKHGITSNYWYTPQTEKGVFMESPKFILTKNIFQKIFKKGMKSAVMTSKDKLKKILEPGTSIAFSAEFPPDEIVRNVGPAENIYSAEINHWLFASLKYLLKNNKDIDFFYVSTTDYIMHKYGPEEAESIHHLAVIDRMIGEILNDFPNLEIYITADHGMNEKTTALNLELYLEEAGINSVFVPAIKDRYIVHHNNLGGVGYIHVIPSEGSSIEEKNSKKNQAIELLKGIQGVEEVYSADDAALYFNLLKQRIGDIMVLGAKPYVFGSFPDKITEVSIRSHGSRYESKIPIIGYNSKIDSSELNNSYDIIRQIDL